MLLRIKLSIIIFLLINLASYITSSKHEHMNSNDGILLNKLIQIIVNNGRRDFKPWKSGQRAGTRDNNRHFRSNTEEENSHNKDDKQAVLVESELKEALAYKKSALFDKPRVESHGKNDFLVLQTDVEDPFVTIVPNAVYYNVEKKCVNWLDDCNLKGLHNKFLQTIHYKK